MIVAARTVVADALSVNEVFSEAHLMSIGGVPVTNAIIYCPGSPVDLAGTRAALAHVRRRGYTLAAYTCNWAAVDRALANRRAQVVVFADNEAPADEAATQSLLTPERMRRIVDAGATPPAGVDPEAVAALRRIARLIAGNSGRASRCVKGEGVPKGDV
jgi:hypothetical protein